jgi:hypothetical protein
MTVMADLFPGTPPASPAPESRPGPARYARLVRIMLDQIRSSSQSAQELKRQLAECPAPELGTLLSLHQVLLLRELLKARTQPDLRTALDLFRPLLEWARLEEKRREIALAEQKLREAKEARTAPPPKREPMDRETLALIEQELHLFSQ